MAYRIAGNIGSDLNLVVWWSGKRPPNLNQSNFTCAYITCALGGPTAKFKSANTQDQTAKFKDRQYFRLYGTLRSVTVFLDLYAGKMESTMLCVMCKD